MDDRSTRLSGLRVLVLEDEALLAMLMEDVLGEFGCITIGPFDKCDAALAFLAADPQGCDLGILDVNVSGQTSDAVAQALDRLSLPFVFSTGYDETALHPDWRARPCLHKPFRPADLERVLLEIIAG
jgi:two-component SAPR family response regulator